MSALERLKNLFRELFQLDVADLDFGIYRLLHLKRKEVEAFLSKDLPAAVDREFKAAAGAEQATLEKDLKELTDRIRQDIGPDALQPNGEPAPTYANAKLAKDYAAKRKQLEAVEATEAQKAEVFNHLYTFFRRYYDEGDFIPRRFYGARESYAVPYNGEEVLFHWANKDQHYVKTGEVFRDYTFKIETLLGTFTVPFKLAQATTAKDNTKGGVRFFFALPKDTEYDKAAKVFVVPFEYRLPTEAEVQRYGSGAKGQDALIIEAAKKILAAVPDETLMGELAKVVDVKNPDDAAKREEVTLLLKRLRHFTKKNTTDYFIHKNLGGFLHQELDFYIKDQVVQAADLEGDFDAKRRMLRVFRALAERVIAFLHQIEDAQRRLFEKKKFVLRTDYLIPIMHVPRELWPEVLANKAQMAEWKDLLSIEPKVDLFNKKGVVNEQFLMEHPTLVIDTAHFDPALAARLISGLPDLDVSLSGVAVKSDNYHALTLLAPRYRSDIRCVYIDPPYNTGSDEFCYKDRFQHSSWAAMMHERLGKARDLIRDDGAVFVSIDSHELPHITKVMEDRFGPANDLGTLIWKNATDNNPTRIAVEHEYIRCFAKNAAMVAPEWKSTYSDVKELLLGQYQQLKDSGLSGDDLQGAFRQFIKDNASTVGELERYKFIDDDGPYTGSESVHNPHPGGYDYEIYHPKSKKPMRKPANGYRFPWETMKREYIDRDRLIYGPDENRIVKIKLYLRDYLDSLRSVILLDGRLGAYALSRLFGQTEAIFKNPKPVELLDRLLSFSTRDQDWVLDFVAGSSTTGQAVIELNRAEGTSRRFVMVELADYFDSVLLLRLKKVIYTSHWQDGKPTRLSSPDEIARTPQLVQVIRLESYEDALHKVGVGEARGRTTKKAEAVRTTAGEERYRLNYLVKLPLDASDTMLNVKKLEHPFSYTVEVLTDDGPREQSVDLVETFNWLYGLRVKRLLTWEAKQGKETRKYRVVVATDRDNRKRILVVWRDITGLDPKAERAFLEVEIAKLGEFEEKWINGDCAVPGLASLDGLFKRLMEAES